jgi:amino acid transporter
MMPGWLGRIHPRFGTPWAAVLVSVLFYAALAAFSFKDLVILTVWLYSLGLAVELAAFVWLRVAEPAMARPWRVPGGLGVAALVAAAPMVFIVLALATAGWYNTLAGLGAALSGPVAWAALRPSAGRATA